MSSADVEDTGVVVMTLTLNPTQSNITLMVHIRMCDVLPSVIMPYHWQAQQRDGKEQSVTPLLVRREDRNTEVDYED